MTDFSSKIDMFLNRLTEVIKYLNLDEINTFMNILLNARDTGKTIFIMGNGGSAATASHFCCDFNKGLSYNQSSKFKFICLNDNIPTMMAYANDVSYDNIFVEQLKNFLTPGDLVIGVSGSGNSKNILKAIDYANKNDAETIGLIGFNGGKLKQKVKHSVHVNIDDMQITEIIHMSLCHMIYSILMTNKNIQHLDK